MNKTVLVSIITVVYNGEKYLNQTIKSVINQTYDNIEYIIVDGGSKDKTLDIIKSFGHKISNWVSESDEGLYDAMNKGISMANGELIGMINSDDWFEPNAVEIVVNQFLKNPNKKIFHGDRYDVLENGHRKIKKFHKSSLKFIYYGMTYNHPSMFVKKEIYECGMYNNELTSLSDYEFTLRNYLINKGNFHYIHKSYVNYRLDGISSKIRFSQMIKEGFISRRNAGLNIISNLFSVFIRAIIAFKAGLLQ